jgi:hypothetical protein
VTKNTTCRSILRYTSFFKKIHLRRTSWWGKNRYSLGHISFIVRFSEHFLCWTWDYLTCLEGIKSLKFETDSVISLEKIIGEFSKISGLAFFMHQKEKVKMHSIS